MSAAPAAADPNYQVRRLRPQDAEGVRDLVRRVYGNTYLHAELYEPERLLRLNDGGQLVSAVALDAGHRVVGHYALERPDLGPVAETGEGMVLPEHRGHHLFQRLRAFLEDEARRLSLFGLTGRPTTSHVLSQKVYQEFACHPTGLELARACGLSLDQSADVPQPTSVLMYFKFLAAPPPAVYHLPDHHHALARRIAERLGREVTFRPGVPAVAPGRLDVEYQEHARAGYLRVTLVGGDSLGALEQARADLCARGAGAVFLRLPLAQPGSAALCEAAERRGFFFSGLDPRPADAGDVLQLQYLAVPVDPAALHVEDEFAREIVAYVLARQRGGAR